MMRDMIANFASQFAYEPKIENGQSLKSADKFIVCGMGGSHLAADVLRTLKPQLNILIHEDYNLPKMDEKCLGESLIIASSYSGNTEEVLSAAEEAHARKFNLLCIAVGGKLIDFAKTQSIAYIQMPDTGIQPRLALGYSFCAMLLGMGEVDMLKKSALLAETLKPESYEKQGKGLSEKIKGKVPVIYASTRNYSLAYNWKIKLNETCKIPAFCNVFPELNHNEMTGFDVKESSRSLSQNFIFLLLKDRADHPQIQKRMEVLAKLYRDRGLPVELIDLEGESEMQKIFGALLTADWLALLTAESLGLESEQVPMVEEFKKLIG